MNGMDVAKPKDFIYVCENKETLYVRDVHGTYRLATDKDWELLEKNRGSLICETQCLSSGGVIVICSDE